MWCKVVVFHCVWLPEIGDWHPSGFDFNTGTKDINQWRQEFSEPIPSIKSFDDRHIDVTRLHEQIILNIKAKFDIEGLCGLKDAILRNRYIVISSDEIVAEYDDGAFECSTERNHMFIVYITPSMQEK